jgi:hypothetical protein
VIQFWRNRTYALNYLPPLLDRTVPSRFNTSTLILTIVENCLIEGWSQQVSYSSFFDQCYPSYCTYSVNELPDIIYIVTTLIGVLSGLNVVLKLLIPLLVQALYWCWGYVHGMFFSKERTYRSLVVFDNNQKSSSNFFHIS